MSKKGNKEKYLLLLRTEKYKKRRDEPMLPEKFYLLDIHNKENPKLLNNAFNCSEDARRAVRQELDHKFSRFKIITGELAIKHGLLFKRNSFGTREKAHVKNYKYEYPPDRLGDPKRMSYWRNMQQAKRKKALLKSKQINP